MVAGSNAWQIDSKIGQYRLEDGARYVNILGSVHKSIVYFHY